MLKLCVVHLAPQPLMFWRRLTFFDEGQRIDAAVDTELTTREFRQDVQAACLPDTVGLTAAAPRGSSADTSD